MPVLSVLHLEMPLKKHIRLIGLLAASGALAAGLVSCALAWSRPIPGLTRKDVVEIKAAAWRAAWGDILPSFSAKDLRAVPEKLLFIYRVKRVTGGHVGEPNVAGFVFCGLLVPGTRDDETIDYGATKVQGRWVIRRMPSCGGSWHKLNAALRDFRGPRPLTRGSSR